MWRRGSCQLAWWTQGIVVVGALTGAFSCDGQDSNRASARKHDAESQEPRFLCGPRLMTQKDDTVWAVGGEFEDRGTPCRSSNECASNQVCKLGEWIYKGVRLVQTCQPRNAGGPGTWCRTGDECATGLICEGLGGTTTAPLYPEEEPTTMAYRRCLEPCEVCALKHQATCDAAAACKRTSGCLELYTSPGELGNEAFDAAELEVLAELLGALQQYCPSNC